LSIDGDKQGEIGYVLNRNNWNQGLMTECARKVISFGFGQLGMHRIFGGCDPANTASYRVMEKLGMQKEGHLREHEFRKGLGGVFYCIRYWNMNGKRIINTSAKAKYLWEASINTQA